MSSDISMIQTRCPCPLQGVQGKAGHRGSSAGSCGRRCVRSAQGACREMRGEQCGEMCRETCGEMGTEKCRRKYGEIIQGAG